MLVALYEGVGFALAYLVLAFAAEVLALAAIEAVSMARVLFTCVWNAVRFPYKYSMDSFNCWSFELNFTSNFTLQLKIKASCTV